MRKITGQLHDKLQQFFSRFNQRMALRLYFTLKVFYIMFVTMVLVGATAMLLLSSGHGNMYSLTCLPIILACLVSVIVGTALSAYISKRIFAPISELSQAAAQVTHGDFSVRLNVDSKINEIRTTCESFNQMVEGLSGIETLRNDFVANVSHEFKTPITAIEGYAMLLQDPSLTAEEQAACADKILAGTARLTTLVGNILTLSKIENQSLGLIRHPFRLDEQIRRAIVELEPKWSAKNIEFAAELEHIICFGAESLLAQVWSNLLDNAIKFSPTGGIISVRAWQEGDWVLVSVGDQGPGVPEEAIPHIFEKFYQADSSHRQEGNGLGLTLVQEIAHLHGGGVEVANADGAVFTVHMRKG